MKPAHAVRDDFDRIARLSEGGSDALGPDESYLLQFVPDDMDEALETGCGRGSFTRSLYERARHVTGIDVSPGMIEAARRRSTRISNVEYVLADATTTEVPVGRFDCVASITTLHHRAHPRQCPR